MDLQKIGAYIASKRKALGMTQTELAEKLGMSNKSVSKWERGVCLPDVSLYMELCDILGITINEFIAGEDLPEERFVEKSDENIISVTKDGKQRSRRLKLALGVLAIALALLMAVMVVLHLPRQNYIKPLPKDSTEMMAAEIVAGMGEVHMYAFSVDDSYKEVSVNMITYEKGRMAESEKLFGYQLDGEHTEGILAIVSDFSDHDVKVAVSQDDGTGSAKFEILEGVKHKDLYSRAMSAGLESEKIVKGQEKGILCMVYDKDDSVAFPGDAVLAGADVEENDYTYCFTVKFE
ncbi:MAG: helix-turn-helix transcriptional regulator [Firmicutes bacterium]|nr:helix-turn-helix transcriptional regulator [Bacillota bacterium]